MAQMMTSSFPVNNTFDPLNQSFAIFEPDGVTTFLSKLSDIRTIYQSGVRQAIGQGTQIGAALILLVALLLMTKTDKRRSFVFMLNGLALFFVVLRGIISCAVYTGPFYDFYRWELLYYTDIGNAKSVSAAGEVVTFLLTLVIELSLVLQVRIVCCTLDPRKRNPLNVLNSLVALAAVAVRFALMVVNIHWGIMHVESETVWQFERISMLASGTNITLVISIGISAVIFCTKLAFAIEARRSMGMTQFGPMQIIFVMGFQTMCTPRRLQEPQLTSTPADSQTVIFTIIAYWVVKNAQMGSFVPTVVAISLPLSAMWAAVNNSNVHIANANSRVHRAIPVGGPDLASGKAYGTNKETFSDSIKTTDTLVDDGGSSTGLTTPKRKARFSKEDDDLEMQRVGEGVQVDRSYSVRSD